MCYDRRMTTSREQEIERLHKELAWLYRLGGSDRTLIESYWARIERLESEHTRINARKGIAR